MKGGRERINSGYKVSLYHLETVTKIRRKTLWLRRTREEESIL